MSTTKKTSKGTADAKSLFKKSPFSCSMAILEFKEGDSLKVHADLLRQSPKLATLSLPVDPWSEPQPSPYATVLKRISRSAGHILVNYLYTNKYRTLEWVGPADSQKETITKLEVAFEVYATAREFDLEGLEALATKKITLLSKDVDAFTVIDIVKEAYPCARGNDTWFPAFIKDTIRTASEKPPTSPTAKAATEEATTADTPAPVDVPLAKLLLQGALEVYREKVEALTAKATPVSAPQFGFPTAMAAHEKRSSFSLWGSSWDNPTGNTCSFGGINIAEQDKAAEPAPKPSPAEEAKQQEPVDDEWALPAKKSKKVKKSKRAEPKPELEKEEPVEAEWARAEPEPELEKEEPVEAEWARAEPEPEQEAEPVRTEGALATKKIKKGKKSKRAEPEPQPEPPKEPEPEPELPKEPEPEPKPVKDLEVVAEQPVTPVDKEWVGAESDPWSFWGAKKSPRSSM